MNVFSYSILAQSKLLNIKLTTMNRLFFLLIAIALGVVAGNAQETIKLQVVTKQVEQSFPYLDGSELNLEGQKAEVEVKTWKKKEISVRLELVSKHADRKMAERDLERIKYEIKRVSNKIYARNFVKVPEGETKTESTLAARYTVTIPEDCPVYLKNYFGYTNVSDLSNRLKINSQFSKIGLTNIRGLIDVDTRFGDLTGNKLDGNVSIASRRSNITLKELKGSLDIQAQYGILNIYSSEQLQNLNIIADNSDVFLYNLNPEKLGYNLKAKNANFDVPNDLKFVFTKNLEDQKEAQFKPQTEIYPFVRITISFGDLTIRRKN